MRNIPNNPADVKLYKIRHRLAESLTRRPPHPPDETPAIRPRDRPDTLELHKRTYRADCMDCAWNFEAEARNAAEATGTRAMSHARIAHHTTRLITEHVEATFGSRNEGTDGIR